MCAGAISSKCKNNTFQTEARFWEMRIDRVFCDQKSINISCIFRGDTETTFHIYFIQGDITLISDDYYSRSDAKPQKFYQVELQLNQNNLPPDVGIFNSDYVNLVKCPIDYIDCSLEIITVPSTDLRSFTNFTTSHSLVTFPSTTSINHLDRWHLAYYIIPIALLLSVAFIFVCFRNASKRSRQLFSKTNKNTTKETKQNHQALILSKFNQSLSKRTEEMLEKSKQTVKIFLIFMDENAKHRKTVINLVNYLQADLGFEVICELFANVEISVDPFAWMEKSLEEADKVIVIWSPGAANRWDKNCSNDIVRHDLFTPVLKQIRNDIFRNTNIGKYYFAYFDYCTQESIPKVFSEPKVFHFKLMHQFDELYFRLKGMEKYIPGGVIKEEKVMFDCYADPEINKFGNVLQESINEMNAYVNNNPNWRSDFDGNETIPGRLNLLEDDLEDNGIKQFKIQIFSPTPLKEVDTKTSFCNSSVDFSPKTKQLVQETNLQSIKIFDQGTNGAICTNDVHCNFKKNASFSKSSALHSLSLKKREKSIPFIYSNSEMIEKTKLAEVFRKKETFLPKANTFSCDNNSKHDASKSCTSGESSGFKPKINPLSTSNVSQSSDLFNADSCPDKEQFIVKEKIDLENIGQNNDRPKTGPHVVPYESSCGSGYATEINLLERNDRCAVLLSQIPKVLRQLDIDSNESTIEEMNNHQQIRLKSNISNEQTLEHSQKPKNERVKLVPLDLTSDPMASLLTINRFSDAN